jgi:uncharacterized membrane protein YhaH (DUF805 family)
MSFGAAISSFWKNYVNFQGRARRSEYWFATLFLTLVSIPVAVISFDAQTMTYGPLYWLWAAAVLLPGISLVVRRLHDTGKSGWFYLLVLIPFVGAIVLLVFMVMDSQPGANKYGNPVK